MGETRGAVYDGRKYRNFRVVREGQSIQIRFYDEQDQTVKPFGVNLEAVKADALARCILDLLKEQDDGPLVSTTGPKFSYSSDVDDPSVD